MGFKFPCWDRGVCPRGHDITDPANVYDWTNIHGVHLRRCRVCVRIRDARRPRTGGYRRAIPLAPMDVRYPPRECEWCEKTYHHEPRHARSRAVWQRRRFCSSPCVLDAMVAANQDRARPGRRVHGSRTPLSDEELARLRRAVGIAS